MKENDDLEGLTPEEKLQADSDLLKIKLEMEFGMQAMGGSPNMDDKMQNDFLNYVYNFEKESAKKKSITVFEKIGKPIFKKAESITNDELNNELQRILSLLETNGIALDTVCKYPDHQIYKFITEELFTQETDDINIPGKVNHFIYEEFHPNNEYDITQNAKDFIHFLINKKWKEYHESTLATTVEYNGIKYAKDLFVNIIDTFQEAEGKLRLVNWEARKVLYDLEKKTAELEGKIKYKSVATKQIYEGNVRLSLALENDIWCVSKVVLPGFSN
jgi:hypothetical protein